MVERYPDKIEVGGSIPPLPTLRVATLPQCKHLLSDEKYPELVEGHLIS